MFSNENSSTFKGLKYTNFSPKISFVASISDRYKLAPYEAASNGGIPKPSIKYGKINPFVDIYNAFISSSERKPVNIKLSRFS